MLATVVTIDTAAATRAMPGPTLDNKRARVRLRFQTIPKPGHELKTVVACLLLQARDWMFG